MKVLFSVLKYKLITNESINIGILFHNLDTDERRFETITKWSRVKIFDDEINIKFFKILLNGMRGEIQNSLLSSMVNFDISTYTKKFHNEMRFSRIYEDYTDNFNEFIEFNKRNFLRYDYDKKDRPDRDQQVKYMKRLMKSKSISYSVKKTEGLYKENIQYDYIIDDYAFKFFAFENKKLDALIHTAKSWAYTAEEMSSIYKTIFVYDMDVNDKKFDVIINILSKSAYKVIKYDDTLDYVLSKYENRDSIIS